MGVYIELLIHQEDLTRDPFKKAIWINKTFQKDVYRKLVSKNQFEVESLDDIPNFDGMGKQYNTVVVLDDLLSEASRTSQCTSLFTKGRHFSVIFLSHNIFHQGKHSRDM